MGYCEDMRESDWEFSTGFFSFLMKGSFYFVQSSFHFFISWFS